MLGVSLPQAPDSAATASGAIATSCRLAAPLREYPRRRASGNSRRSPGHAPTGAPLPQPPKGRARSDVFEPSPSAGQTSLLGARADRAGVAVAVLVASAPGELVL